MSCCMRTDGRSLTSALLDRRGLDVTQHPKDCLSPPFAAPANSGGPNVQLPRLMSMRSDVSPTCCYPDVHRFRSSMTDYARQHQLETAPVLSNLDPRLRSILAAALRKPPAGRPTLSRLASVLADVDDNPTGVGGELHALRQANAAEAERASDIEARAATQRQRDRERNELIAAGEQVLKDLSHETAAVARHNAPEWAH